MEPSSMVMAEAWSLPQCALRYLDMKLSKGLHEFGSVAPYKSVATFLFRVLLYGFVAL
jgi:hypothetical protein